MPFRLRLLLLALLCLSGTAALGQVETLDLDAAVADIGLEVEQTLAESGISSAGVALVVGDSVVWSGGFGLANRWAETPARAETVYLFGSTVKPFIAAAVLQLAAEGNLDLDDPVREILAPLEIRGEDPEHPVTFRHLLTHTSGLPPDFGPVPVWSDRVPPDLRTYLETSLRVTAPPGRRLVYSNMGFALLAYLVEHLSGMPFLDYMQRHFFDPLDMHDTAYAMRPDMDERLALPYVPDADGLLHPTDRLKARVWPAMMAYGTPRDLGHWLAAILNDGAFRSHTLLTPAQVDTLLTLQTASFPGPVSDLWGGATAGYGLGWWVDTIDGVRYFAHSGSAPGYTAFVLGDRDRRVGVVLLTNGHHAHAPLVDLAHRIVETLAGHQAHRVGN